MRSDGALPWAAAGGIVAGLLTLSLTDVGSALTNLLVRPLAVLVGGLETTARVLMRSAAESAPFILPVAVGSTLMSLWLVAQYLDEHPGGDHP